jgi:pantothenate kinase
VDEIGELVQRARRLVDRDERSVLGICGAPGVGKSRLAAMLAEALGPVAVVVPMDGFHLQDDELTRLGRLDFKGAPDTFDVDGYVGVLRRVAAGSDRTVYAPSFDRDRELSLASAIPVRPEHRLVITEGNYLLLDDPGWQDIRALLTECWFLVGDDVVRRERLIDRHVRHGRSREAATDRVMRNDEPNADLVASTLARADLVIGLA